MLPVLQFAPQVQVFAAHPAPAVAHVVHVVHVAAVPLHDWQVDASPSGAKHALEAGWKTSIGQTVLEPVQFSPMSQPLTGGRQVTVGPGG